MALSTRPWGDIAESDYTMEQWHRACLMHLHEGEPMAKGQCKLPVLEPNGTPNRNGMFAAQGALLGARGGVDAPPDKKKSAARKLIGMMRANDMQPSPRLLELGGY